jgi:hypothetical protein
MNSPADDRIEKARLKVAQAKARLEAIEARATSAERKADTRRKIILGGLLLDAAGKDPRYASVLDVLLLRIAREADRRPFNGWTPPVSASAD